MHQRISQLIGFFKKVAKADIIKVFSLTSIATLVRMCTGLISVKVVASIIGPSGVALVGQLGNFSSILLTFSNGGINGGITKYVSEYKTEETKLKLFLSTAFKITIGCSIICGLLLILFHTWLSNKVMLTPEYGYVFLIFGITIIFYALNNMLISTVNGFKEFRKYVYINIANSIIGVTFSVALVLCLGLPGALISSVTYQSVMLFVTVCMVRKTQWFQWKYYKSKFNKIIANKYFKYSLMTLTVALTTPIVQMILRGYVMAKISTVEAGWWEGMNRISAMYLLVITSSFSVYYLPRLSEIHDKLELRKEIIKVYKVIVPILIIGIIIIYLGRYLIINILFTKDFLPMSQLFSWQLMGDFFKICSWLLSYIMIAKAMTKIFIFSEVFFNALYLFMGWLCTYLNGIVGLTQAYMINYILYFLGMVYLFRNIVMIRKS